MWQRVLHVWGKTAEKKKLKKLWDLWDLRKPKGGVRGVKTTPINYKL